MAADVRQIVPAPHHRPLAGHGFERFHTRDRFHQQSLLQPVIGLRIARGIAHLSLQEEARSGHQCHGNNRNQREPSSDIGYHANEQHKECHVDDQHDGGRCKEIAHGGILAHARRQRSGAALPGSQGQPHDPPKQFLRELDIQPAANLVDHIGSRSAQRKFHRKGKQDTNAKHP